jgi:hypothetical protein
LDVAGGGYFRRPYILLHCALDSVLEYLVDEFLHAFLAELELALRRQVDLAGKVLPHVVGV